VEGALLSAESKAESLAVGSHVTFVYLIDDHVQRGTCNHRRRKRRIKSSGLSSRVVSASDCGVRGPRSE